MDRETVIAKLRDHDAELKSAGVLRLALFGSVARGDAKQDSDVDLMVRFDKSRCRTLFDQAGVEQRISEILNVRVELTPENMMYEQVKAQAEHEAVLVF